MGKGEIDGVPCHLIVDTGAKVTIIRPDAARRMKKQLVYTGPPVSLQTASGDKINVHVKLEVNISFGFKLYQHRLYVAEIPDPCILGLDFLKDYGFMLYLKKRELQAAGEEVPLFRLDTEVYSSCRILALEDITVPARAEFVAKGIPESGRSFKFEVTDFPDTEKFPRGELVREALIDVSKEVVPVRLTNYSDGTTVIRTEMTSDGN